MSLHELVKQYYEDTSRTAKKKFENHVATYDVLSETISVLTWKEPGSNLYMVRYVMDGRQLYISGDLGSAVFDLTWNATPQSFNGIGYYYFTEKLHAYSRERYVIDSDVLKAELNERFDELTDGHPDEDEIKELKEVFEQIEGFDTVEEIAGYINHSNAYNILQNFDVDAWEWIYNVGQVISPNIVYYLVGLQLASKQLGL